MNKRFFVGLMLLTPMFLHAQPKYINRDIAKNVDVNQSAYSATSLRTFERATPSTDDKLKNKETIQTYLPVFSKGINFSANPSARRLNVKTELLAAKMNSIVQSRYQFNENAKPRQYSYHFSSWKVSFIPQVMYSFYNKHQLKWYIGIGGSLSALLIAKNSITGEELNKATGQEIIHKDYLRYNRFYLTPIVRTGIQLNQTIDLSLIFSNRANYTGLSSRQKARGATVGLGASYIFHR